MSDNSSPNDPINPQHYKNHPSGVEAITITEWFNFNCGNALKYIWRSQERSNIIPTLIDLRKARWYIAREIARIEQTLPPAWVETQSHKPSQTDKPILSRKSKAKNR